MNKISVEKNFSTKNIYNNIYNNNFFNVFNVFNNFYRTKCVKKLQDVFNKKNIYFVERGNKAIYFLLKRLRSFSDVLLIQDQSGWITYEQFGKKLKYHIVKLKTNNGIIEQIPKEYSHAVLILHSMPGYHSLQNMLTLKKQANKLNIKIVNDATGSIITKEAKIGDYILVSSNRDKPLNYERMGIIATDENLEINQSKDNFVISNTNIIKNINFRRLNKHIQELPERIKQLKVLKNEVLKKFKDFEIVENKGINFIVLSNPKNETEIIRICEKNKYPFVLCPRYIRLNKRGVSVEIKRLEVKNGIKRTKING